MEPEVHDITDFDFARAKKQEDLCPCCSLPLNSRRQKVGVGPAMMLTRTQSATMIRDSSISLLLEDEEAADDMDETERGRWMLPGILENNVAYSV